MAELGQLGPHMDGFMSKHEQDHAQKIADENEKRENGKTERLAKAQEMHDKLERMLNIESKWNEKSALSSRSLGQREDGTAIAGNLSFNAGIYNDQALRLMTGPRYVDQGLIRSQQYKGRRLTSRDVLSDDPGFQRYPKPEFQGLDVRVALHSKDEKTDQETHSSVVAGSILDPESILVPELPLEDGTEQFSIIGAEDSRFAPIMETMAALTDPSTPQAGRRSIVG